MYNSQLLNIIGRYGYDTVQRNLAFIPKNYEYFTLTSQLMVTCTTLYKWE